MCIRCGEGRPPDLPVRWGEFSARARLALASTRRSGVTHCPPSSRSSAWRWAAKAIGRGGGGPFNSTAARVSSPTRQDEAGNGAERGEKGSLLSLGRSRRGACSVLQRHDQGAGLRAQRHSHSAQATGDQVHDAAEHSMPANHHSTTACHVPAHVLTA